MYACIPCEFSAIRGQMWAELQVIVRCHWLGELNPGLLEERPVPFTPEPCSQLWLHLLDVLFSGEEIHS